jgi:hypothetical protein
MRRIRGLRPGASGRLSGRTRRSDELHERPSARAWSRPATRSRRPDTSSPAPGPTPLPAPRCSLRQRAASLHVGIARRRNAAGQVAEEPGRPPGFRLRLELPQPVLTVAQVDACAARIWPSRDPDVVAEAGGGRADADLLADRRADHRRAWGAFIRRRGCRGAPGRNQAQLIPGAVCPEQRSDTIATRWLVRRLTTPPPLPTHGPRASRPDRLPRCAQSGSLPRILVYQPVHARPADHLTAGNCRDHSRSTRLSQLQAAMRSVPVVVLDVLGQDLSR